VTTSGTRIEPCAITALPLVAILQLDNLTGIICAEVGRYA